MAHAHSVLKSLLLRESRRIGGKVKRLKRLADEAGEQPRRPLVLPKVGSLTKTRHRADVIPTSVLQKILYPKGKPHLVKPVGTGPHIPRVKHWDRQVIVPAVRWDQKGPYLGTRSFAVPRLEIAQGLDFLEYQERPDRNIDRLKRTFYVASFLAAIFGKVNHAFTRGFSLFVRGYFRTARKCFHSYVEGVKRMYKLSTRSIGLLLSLVHQVNDLCMQIAG